VTWQVKSAAELSTENLKIMAAVVKSATYDQAMAEAEALAQEDFQL
jgi:hypothetical protein